MEQPDFEFVRDPDLAARIRRAIPEQVRKANAREQAQRCAQAARLAVETPPTESQRLQARYMANGGCL